MKSYPIGELSRKLGIHADTLRYYERLGLLGRVPRAPSGRRMYDHRSVSRLKFIRRAQQMNFSLAEIGGLLQMRENPRTAREDVRNLMATKLEEVEARLEALTRLRTEMQLLISLCRGASAGCPILDNIGGAAKPKP